MRRFLLVLALLLTVALPARADRVMEVQGIRVDGAAGRDAAVAEATKQAAQQVWSRMGRSTPLPELSPTQLQGIASYVDVANEVAQPNYYAGSFNVGIQVGALMRIANGGSLTAPQDEVSEAPSDAYRPGQPYAAPAPVHDAPDWVMIIAGRENNGTVTLWNAEDPWTKAWQRAPSADLATAVATGDPTDQTSLNPTMVQEYDPALADRLRTIARKYGAPAIALMLLDSQRPDITANEEVKIEVTYLEKDMPDVMTSQGTLFVPATLLGNVYGAAVGEGQKLLSELVSGTSGAQPQPASNAYAYQPSGQPGLSGQFGNTYTGPAATAAPANKLWVRIPLATPADLGNYRRKIESIPGARFEVTALNRMYVEGNILYSGDQNVLMQQLAAAGLRQQ